MALSVVTQPVAGGSIAVREMQPSDAEFASAMQVAAFKSKIEHAIGKEKLDALRSGIAHEISTRPAEGFTNHYIAWYNNERAGYLRLIYHGVKSASGDESFAGLGCWNGIRLLCLDSALSGGDVIKDMCYLETICVDEQWRGKAIGKTLLDWADAQAREHACKMIYLNVIYGNRAKNLYERQGYTVVHTKEGCCLRWSAGVEGYYNMEKPL